MLALFAILALTGDLEESTVMKINKDGSEVIHTRKYENTQAGKGLLGGLGGGEAQEEEKIDAPTEEELKAKAKAMVKASPSRASARARTSQVGPAMKPFMLSRTSTRSNWT